MPASGRGRLPSGPVLLALRVGVLLAALLLWHVLTAAAFITMILPLLVFLALQRYFIRGILAGSVKG